jgi:succinyl-CoA synthetase beta subunit
MPFRITGERLTSLFRPRSVALVGASDKPAFALTAVIARIGDLALALGDDLESLEVNPLLVDGTRIEALDAVLTWREQS